MKKFTIPLILVGVTALLASLAFHQKRESIVGKPAPSFKLELLKGGQIDSNDLKGKSVMLYFFASW